MSAMPKKEMLTGIGIEIYKTIDKVTDNYVNNRREW